MLHLDVRVAYAFAKTAIRRFVASVSWPNVIPLTIALSFILSTGPHIQQYLYARLNSDADSIYGTAYQTSLVQFPTLTTWLVYAIHPLYLVMACIIAVISLGYSQPRPLFRSVSVASCVVLLVCDLIFAIVGDNLTIKFFFENVIANLLGGVAIGLLVVTLLTLCEACFRYMAVPIERQSSATWLMLPFAGLITSTTAYYTADFFYRPISIEIDVDMGSSSTGKIGLPLADQTAANKHPPFHLVQPHFEAEFAGWIAPESNLRVRWTAASSQLRFNAKIDLLSGCVPSANLPAANAPLLVKNVETLTLSSNVGFSEFSTTAAAGGTYQIGVAPGDFVSFWLDTDQKTQKSKITQFVTDEAELSLSSTSGQYQFFLNTYLFGAGPRKRQVADVVALSHHVNINGQIYPINLKAQKESADFKIECRSLSAAHLLQGKATLVAAAGFSGIRIQMALAEPSSVDYVAPHGELKVGGGSGYVEVRGAAAENLSSSETGSVNFFSFHGKATRFDLDGKSYQMRPFDNFVALGNFEARYVESGNLITSGNAFAVWRDNLRLNPTKWERLPTNSGPVLGTVLVTVLAGAIAFVGARLQRNHSFKWLKRAQLSRA